MQPQRCRLKLHGMAQYVVVVVVVVVDHVRVTQHELDLQSVRPVREGGRERDRGINDGAAAYLPDQVGVGDWVGVDIHIVVVAVRAAHYSVVVAAAAGVAEYPCFVSSLVPRDDSVVVVDADAVVVVAAAWDAIVAVIGIQQG